MCVTFVSFDAWLMLQNKYNVLSVYEKRIEKTKHGKHGSVLTTDHDGIDAVISSLIMWPSRRRLRLACMFDQRTKRTCPGNSAPRSNSQDQ